MNVWFDYPVHKVDQIGSLKDIEPENEKQHYSKNFGKKKTPDERKEERKRSLENAYEALSINGKVTVKDMEEYFTLTKNAVKNRIKEHGKFEIQDGVVIKK